ncbi:Nucleotide-rhamnose synthase/epimerase-reductase, putative [Theobroma cacao]|uniref:Nucleotide-rhamnose synthase/epimerase-reductase, putative n=1 Tax=Theobroma cacao TaxID=3641 RepID=A0A061GC18_THECC|nr:Nucleotide-rhamnose synthase/epimerase-reductase, putative [Theobroma cacao]
MEFRADGNAKPLGLRFLIYGRTGCIGGLLGRICEAQGIPFAYGSGRLEDRESLRADIVAVQPSHVFNAAGATGRPNVDWCEFNKIETIRSNAIGALSIADILLQSTEQPSPNPNSSSFTPLPELILPGSSTRLLLYSPRPRGHTHNAIPSRFSFPGDLLALVALWP